MLRSIVDSTGQVARITVFMKDIGTEKMHQIEEAIAKQTEKLFPQDQYKVHLTGKAYMFTKGTDYLVGNLIQSLLLTIVIIAVMDVLYVPFVQNGYHLSYPQSITTTGYCGSHGICRYPTEALYHIGLWNCFWNFHR